MEQKSSRKTWAAVFDVSEKGKSALGKLCPDLMRSPRMQTYQDKAGLVAPGHATDGQTGLSFLSVSVLSVCLLRTWTRSRPPGSAACLGKPIRKQDRPVPGTGAGYPGQIFLDDLSVVRRKRIGQPADGSIRFGYKNQARSVPVQSVHRRGHEIGSGIPGFNTGRQAVRMP